MIYADTIEDMIAICAGLYRESIVFEATSNGNEWIIKLTGF